MRTWLSFLQREGGVKKIFQHCVDPRSPDTLLHIRSFQHHSEGKHIDRTLQYNVLLPNDFAEHIYLVGRSHDPHSIVQSGWIDSGRERRQEREACGVLRSRKSDVRWSAQRSGVRHDEAQICSVQNNWKLHQHTVYWCHLMAAQSEGLQFYQTRSNAIILYNTLPAVCIERVVNIKSGEELYSKLYQPPELSQRIAFKPNLLYGRQDTTFFLKR